MVGSFGLSLPGEELTGEIPKELSNLTRLNDLSLSYNQLRGQIPPELGKLQNLQVLFLDENQLTGCIPTGLRYVEVIVADIPFCK